MLIARRALARTPISAAFIAIMMSASAVNLGRPQTCGAAPPVTAYGMPDLSKIFATAARTSRGSIDSSIAGMLGIQRFPQTPKPCAEFYFFIGAHPAKHIVLNILPGEKIKLGAGLWR